VEILRRGKSAVTVCSTAFLAMGRAQASRLGSADLPIVVVAHPFGLKSREELSVMAADCARDIAQRFTTPTP
jgi:hypothetical protein